MEYIIDEYNRSCVFKAKALIIKPEKLPNHVSLYMKVEGSYPIFPDTMLSSDSSSK